ncbi:MAG: glucose 1-dehydrogenase [Actinobacteria bacterium]|nr:glucose 1-dehydrogenase [Actinomycetota bacterium]
MRLQGKAALVTGAGSGIGRAIASRFAAEGAAVVVADLEGSGGAATVEQISRAGGRAELAIGDVRSAADAEAMVAAAVEGFGGLHVLCNNAGVGSWGNVTTTAEEEWDRIFDVNVKGIYQVSRFAVPAMLEAGGGSIVNMASISAWKTDRNITAYCASKGAVVTLTKAMAMDHAPEIRVNCLAPGHVRTPMIEGPMEQVPTLEAKLLGDLVVGRFGTTDEIAAAAVFLASDDASFVTGSALVVDGGATAH